ncbi:dephospho-CoA kinase [Pelagovum sp. HNIBRBA483]|uniref:dephospho-CoA kinase n=1 Tax=Pelagovum sp. HNIBRBA483 TaxID=3233341 RepID=UPI0034A56D18
MSTLIGLTGSIGMGKSTTAAMFAAQGVPVWDADKAVHRLYAKSGAAVALVAQLVPVALGPEGIDRTRLSEALENDPSLFPKLEEIVHPLVAQDRANFISAHPDEPFLLFDIPLLFENGAEDWLDVTVVASAPPDLQKSRVLAREGMTESRLDMITSRQMPDAEKRARADYIVPTVDMDTAREAVTNILAELGKTSKDA